MAKHSAAPSLISTRLSIHHFRRSGALFLAALVNLQSSCQTESLKQEYQQEIRLVPELHPGHRADKSYLPSDGLAPVVLKTSVNRRINLRGKAIFGHTINPGLAQYGNERWLATRTDSSDPRFNTRSCSNERKMGLVQIDELGNQVGVHTTFDGIGGETLCVNIEDPRLVVLDDMLFAVFNSPTEISDGHFVTVQTFLAQINISEERVPTIAWQRILTTTDMRLSKWEKNWTPFVYGSELHFIEQTNPPIVLRLDAGDLQQTQTSAIFSQEKPLLLHRVSDTLDPMVRDANLALPWRGGTQALFDESLNEYVSFFHFFTSPDRNKLRRRYYGGFYTFAAEPPFSIRRYVSAPLVVEPISGELHPVSYVFFPSGLIDNQNEYLISFGEADRTMGLATVNKEELYSRLRSVDSGTF